MKELIQNLLLSLQREDKQATKVAIDQLKNAGLPNEGIFEWVYQTHLKKEWVTINQMMTDLFLSDWQRFVEDKEELLIKSLPLYVEKDIRELIAIRKGESDEPIDCVWDEVYGSLNSAQWDKEMSVELADYFRRNYLGLEC